MIKKVKPLLPLFDAERLYWPVLVERMTTEWSQLENLFACQMCKDLAFIAEFAREHPVDDFMRSLCRRIYETAERLNLDQSTTKRDTPQQRLLCALFEGV